MTRGHGARRGHYSRVVPPPPRPMSWSASPRPRPIGGRGVSPRPPPSVIQEGVPSSLTLLRPRHTPFPSWQGYTSKRLAPHRLRDACISARILPRQPWSPLHGLDCTFSEPALTPPEAVCTSSHGLSAWRYPHRSAHPDSSRGKGISHSPSTVREDTVSADCVLAHGAVLTGAHSWMLLTVPGQLALIFSAWRRLPYEPLGARRSERMWARSRCPRGVRRLAP